MDTSKLGWFGKDNYLVIKYIGLGIILSMGIGFFSLIMMAVAERRSGVTYSNYEAIGSVYNGPLTQNSPSLAVLDEAESIYQTRNLNTAKAQEYLQNTSLSSTSGHVEMTAEFVKKGLTYQPTYRTAFTAEYVLSNALDESAAVSFRFPFPAEASGNEISNAILTVDGVEIPEAKTTIPVESANVDSYYYDDYTTTPDALGLEWNGEIPAKGDVTVKVTYDTVGLAVFTYEGIDNPKGAQDFYFTARINGIRSYDVAQGLSVDQRKFGDHNVELTWDKPDLYSKPTISVAIGDKVNPSLQVSRIYILMLPIYIVFMVIVLFLAYKFGRKPLPLIDMFLFTILFVLFFPLLHYLSGFTIDPTIELFANIDAVPYFSMPLYGAFAIAWLVIGGLLLYLVARIEGMAFAVKFLLPTLVLFLGFFPLVVTIPEYSVLLALLGVVALMVIIIQSRIKLAR